MTWSTCPFDDWELVYGVNLRGPALFAKYAMPHMVRRGKGSIINMSSEVIRQGMRGRAHYTATKMGVIGLTYSLAWEGAEHGIRANCIIPGSVATELLDGFHQRLADEEGVPLDEGAGPLCRRLAGEAHRQHRRGWRT